MTIGRVDLSGPHAVEKGDNSCGTIAEIAQGGAVSAVDGYGTWKFVGREMIH